MCVYTYICICIYIYMYIYVAHHRMPQSINCRGKGTFCQTTMLSRPRLEASEKCLARGRNEMWHGLNILSLLVLALLALLVSLVVVVVVIVVVVVAWVVWWLLLVVAVAASRHQRGGFCLFYSILFDYILSYYYIVLLYWAPRRPGTVWTILGSSRMWCLRMWWLIITAVWPYYLLLLHCNIYAKSITFKHHVLKHHVLELPKSTN